MEDVPNAPKCPRCGAPVTPDAPEGLCPHCLLQLSLSAPTDAPSGGTGPGGSGPGGTVVLPPEPKPPPLVSDIAAHFPQLEILECLGRGGMGVVYKARQPKLNRLVALKILAREREGDPHFAERFQREAQALARLNHQNIVTVYDFGEANGLFYLLMEYVDGMNLRELLQSRKMTPEEAIAIVPRICEALQYAHEQGIVHRDIKPENILMDKQGRLKIADFGIAKILGAPGAEQTLTGGRSLGTPHYMAPEQVEKPGTVDHRADIFSLGVVFYEMLTGELPLGRFSAPSKMVHVDVRLDEVVLRALEKEPDRRYQQASQVKTQVETIARTPPVIGGQPDAPTPPVKPPAPAPAHSSPPGPPRHSRFAICGAIWAAFFLVVSLVMIIAASPPFHGLGGRAMVFILAPLLFIPALIGFSAPFGTTILGWMAVAQIRKSSGRIIGLGLAVFDGLVFPLLLLFGLISMTWMVVFMTISRSPLDEPFRRIGGGEGPLMFIWFLTSLLTSGLAGFFIVRAVWRAVNRPPGGGGAVAGSGATAGSSPGWSPLAIAGVACAIMTALTLLSAQGLNLNMRLSQPVFGLAAMELLATLVLGILALVQLRRSPGRYRGYSLAIVALLMCPFMFVLFVAGSWRLARLEARSRVHLDAATAVLASEPLLPEPNVLPPEITAPPTPVAPAFPPPIGWTADAGDSLPPAITDIVNQVRGLLPPGTVFYPPKYGPGGEIPAFLRSVVECTLPAGDSASNYWFDLDTGGSLAEANNHLDDDEQARQSRIRTGFDVGAVLNGAQSGLAGFDLAAMRVSDIEWSAATLLGDLGPMSAAQPEGHVFMGMSSNGPSTFFFKTRWGRLGILQITGLSSNPPGVNFHYKLVEPATNSGSDTPGPGSPPPAVPQSEVQPLAHANLRARFNAAAGIVSFSDRDTAMAELATDAARLGDAVVVKQALGRITSFSSRDDAAAASAREFLKQSRRASALDAAQSITSFSTRDEVLAEAAKDSARAGDAALVKDSLRRITSFSTRDDAAVESGRLLVKAGLRSDALEVARTITSFSLRDEALGELAK